MWDVKEEANRGSEGMKRGRIVTTGVILGSNPIRGLLRGLENETESRRVRTEGGADSNKQVQRNLL